MSEATNNSSAFLPEILKIVHEGINAQAASRGITHIPGPLASEAMLLSLDRIKAMPSDKLRDLSLSGEVGQTIRTSFDSAFNELPTAKKIALMSGRGFRHGHQGAAGSGDQIVNGRLVLGADRSIARWVGIGSQDSGPNSRDTSSNGYRDLPGSQNSFGPEKYTYAQMDALARNLDVPWAMNQPDLLKLGPSALKDVAEAGFRRESYNLLAKDVGLGAKDIVGVAKLAKARGFNADSYTKGAEPAIKAYSDDAADEKDTWQKIGKWGEVLRNPKATKAEKDAAEEAVRGKVKHMIQRHPERADEIKHRVSDPLKLEMERHAAAKAETGAKLAAADTKGTKAENLKKQMAAVKSTSPAAAL